MIFGPIPGFGADRTVQGLLWVVVWIGSFFCFFGLISGYVTVDEEFRKTTHPMQWELQQTLSFTGIIVCLVLNLVVVFMRRDSNYRLGASVFGALPFLASLFVVAETFSLCGF